ncbi:MAG: hypothetical protein QOK21_3759 [Solirubrobacteraceae bacterium]|jgi:hypothetical protein|nr:hypothetical protein [Solirubrobacteraceae bacterium]
MASSSPPHRRTTTAAVLVTVLGVALPGASAASAAPQDAHPVVDARHQALLDRRPYAVSRVAFGSRPAPIRIVRADGMDWGDAALGAGLAVGLTLTGGALAAVARRPRHPLAR